MSAKAIYMMSQSNTKGDAGMATLQAPYQAGTPYSTIQVWNTGGFVDLDDTTNTNQWPEQSNCFGVEFGLMTRIQSYYNTTVYIVKPAWGSHGLQSGAGSAGTYDPSVRGITTGKYDVGISAFNEAYNELFQTHKNDIDILAYVFIGGEADAKVPYAATWEAAMTDFIANIRARTGRPNLPFIICKLSSSVTTVTMPEFATVNTGSDNIAASDSNVFTINTDSCTLQADDTHYTNAGYETLAGLIYDCMVNNNLLI